MAVETGKFLSLSGLSHYDSKIKAWVEAKKYGLASDILDINTKLSNYDTVTSNAAAGKAAGRRISAVCKRDIADGVGL